MNRTEHLLFHLSEECNEVGQRASKAAKFGLSEVQPGQALTNAERLVGEFMDLLGVVQMMESDGLITLPTNDVAVKALEAKRAKVEKFLLYSRECGTLSEAGE